MTGLDKAREVAESLKKDQLAVKTEVLPITPIRANSTGLGIAGLEEEDPSILPIPFVRIVQGQSKKILMKDGTDAPEGSFFFNDTHEAVKELNFCLIKSKVMVINFERDGEVIPTTQRKILGITMDTKKMFMLGLSISSFANYGRLIAQMKDQKVTESWSHIVTAKTLKTENEKGKFYIVEFNLGERLNEDDKKEMTACFDQFKNIFEKKQENDMPF